LAFALAVFGEHARATAAAEQVSPQEFVVGDNFYIAACVYAACLVAVDKDAMLGPDRRTKLAERYAARAVALLTQARDAGYFKNPASRERCGQEGCFEPLGSREDFKVFLRGLEK